MKNILILLVMFLIVGCSDPNSPRYKCVEYETQTILIPMFMGSSVMMVPSMVETCVKWREYSEN